jgi:F-type H+-transporting ATPase subunit delta
MNNPRVNIRYAQALFDLAVERNELEIARANMKLVAKVCLENSDLLALLKSPVIYGSKKIAVFHEIFKDKLDKLTMGFIEIIIRKRREEHLHRIALKFEDLYLEYNNIRKVKVTSAVPLTEKLRSEIRQMLEKQTKGEIIMEEAVDPSIIGGLIIKLEDQIFDDSIHRKLEDLRKEFNTNDYVKIF